jgi:hypothetical protein
MNEIVVVALICAASVQAPDCSRDTALDVVTGPAHTLQECLIQGPVLAAGSGFRGADGAYVKTRCEPRR